MEEPKIFQVPAEITKIGTMRNRALRLQVDTEEGISADAVERLMSLFELRGWFTFNVRKIEADNVVDLPPLELEKYDMEKSPSKRLRNVLFVYFTKRGGEKKDFDNWYVKEIERIIERYKERIPE